MFKTISFLSLASLLLNACSFSMLQSPREKNPGTFIEAEQASLQLNDAAACCQALTELKFLPISDQESLYVPLTTGSQVFNFNSGKSFVQAYQLTTNVSKLKITANSLTELSIDEQWASVTHQRINEINFGKVQTVGDEVFKRLSNRYS